MRAWSAGVAMAGVLLGAVALAQTPPPVAELGGNERAEDAPSQLARGLLFISPMGQPFRGSGEQPQPPILSWFAAADADSDGKVSRDEFVAQSLGFFQQTLDSNRDGQATSFESTALWRAEAPEMLGGFAARTRRPPQLRDREDPTRGGGAGGGAGAPDDAERRRRREEPAPAPSGARAYGITNDVEPVMSCDVDLSRRVSRTEFEACAVRRFEALDANHDGFFELAESERATTLATANQPGAPRPRE